MDTISFKFDNYPGLREALAQTAQGDTVKLEIEVDVTEINETGLSGNCTAAVPDGYEKSEEGASDQAGGPIAMGADNAGGRPPMGSPVVPS